MGLPARPLFVAEQAAVIQSARRRLAAIFIIADI
jgi:hypothetical protein